MAGIASPEKNKMVKVRAAGDDVVILCHKTLTSRIKASILLHSSRDKGSSANPMESSLGQCVKEVITGKWFELDFCSKWCFGFD